MAAEQISQVAGAARTATDVVLRDSQYMRENLAEELDRMAGQNLLITGGGGFLGYYLVHAILHHNRTCDPIQIIQLTVFENGARGFPAWLAALDGEAGIRVINRDITEPLPADMPAFQFIVHAAGIASPIYYRAHPIETMDANIVGLRNLLDYCRKASESESPVKGLLFFSSSEIYGDPDSAHIPTPESYRGNVSCTGPRACYDESKRYGETLCVNFARHYGLPVKIARPFNNYGPGLKITDRRVLPDLARDVLAGRDIVLLSDGSPRRTFCYVADAVIGYYKILVKGRPGEAYNVGVEEPEISMADLARELRDVAKELFGYHGKVVLGNSNDPDYLTDNPQHRCPVIAKARQELGYAPS
ncbi:MAG: NAD-dependent epimerase/dehydratase family protein, partial [Bryobacteraceae bacterium]